MDRILEASPRRTARTTAAVWLFYVAMAGLATFARRGLIVSGEAATTATNILTHERIFRLGYTADLLAIASYLAVTALIYGLLKPVNKPVARLAAFFSLVGCTIQGGAGAFMYAPLFLLHNAQHLSAFKPEELQAFTYILLKLCSQAYTTALAFFAFFNLLIGYLAFKSTFLPRLVGALMAISGVGGLAFLVPSFAARYLPYIMVTFSGEGVLFLWLLIAGVNDQRWNERAVGPAPWHA